MGGRNEHQWFTTAQLLERTIPEPNSGCWIWLGSLDRKGYGRIGGHTLAHRRIYSELVGAIPSGLCLCHRCDTPACVNPEHFFLGTRADNNFDMFRKGRARKRGGALHEGAAS